MSKKSQKWLPGQHVLIRRPDPEHGWFGFQEANIKDVAGVVKGIAVGETEGSYLVEFKHRLSHREMTRPIMGTMLEAFDPSYDEIKYRSMMEGVSQVFICLNNVEKAEAKITGIGQPVRPFPMWPEISVQNCVGRRPVILTTGRLCKLTAI